MNGRTVVGVLLGSWLVACQPPSEDEGWEPTDGSTDGSTAGEATATSEGSTGEATGDSGLDDGSSSGEDTTGTDPDPGDPFDPPPPVEPLPEDRLSDLQAAIDAWLADPAVSSADHGVLIVDPATSQVLYERNPDTARIPASNTKLFSSAVAMNALGEDHRPRATVFGDTPIDGAGVVAGDLHLVGEHDFTWSTEFYGSSRTPLDLLAESLYDEGLRQVQGSVIARGEFLYDGYNFGTYDPPTHRSTAATRFREALIGAGITVSGGTSTAASFDPPPGATELDHWDGPPLSVSAVPVNVLSHNEFADILLRHVGWALGGTSDYPTGAGELYAWFDALGLDSTDMLFNDGSGLSHGNRVSPRQVIALLDTMTAHPDGPAWRRTFAISGVRGTLGGRMTGPDTQGRVHGKTGTLTGTIATSGVLYNRWDRREYLFAILMNSTGSASATRAIHDGVIGEVAADIRGEAAPPAPPVLTAVRHDPGTTVATVEWDPVDGADGYLVWLSSDGLTWSREDARYVTGTEHRAGSLPFAEPELFVRVGAVGPSGEGERSDTYSVLVQDAERRVLIVDGNDRWQSQPQPENPLGYGHDFAAVHARALAGMDVSWDAVANETVIDGQVVLEDYDAVLWVLGEESTVEETFGAAEQDLVADYLDAGGSMLVSGAEIGWDLVDQGDAMDQAFFTDVLGAQYLGDESGTFVVRPEGVLGELPLWGFYTPGTMTIGFADRLAPGAGAVSAGSYAQGLGGDAIIVREGSMVLMGFPFETIDNAPDRADLMARMLELLL